MEDLIARAAKDLASASYAIALTGAGISTESGIPDFRGPSGVWTKDPDAERRSYRGYERFIQDPKAWWEDRLTAPSVLGDLDKAQPNAGHLALADLEELGILRCVITQNVDSLHTKAGSRRVLEYHGSLFKLRCTSCGSRFAREEFDLDRLLVEGLLPPRCPKCRGTVKTDGVSFGEPIPSDVAQQSLEEARGCDLMLICGTSAVVYPFANLPMVARERRGHHLQRPDQPPWATEQPASVTIIEVNAEPTPLTQGGISDYLIQGRTGEILPRIVAAVKSRR